MLGARAAFCITVGVLAVPPFPLISGRRKELTGKERDLHDR
jgi:hypothetical protein